MNVIEAPVLPAVTAEAPVIAAARNTPFPAGPVVTGVIAAGALGLGIATAVASNGTATSIGQTIRPSAEVESLRNQQRTLATLAVAGYAVAGAAAVTTVILAIVGSREPAQSNPVAVGLSLSPTNASVSLSGQF